MGIGFVLLLWLFIGLVLACVSAGTFAATAAFFTRGAQRGRKRLLLAASLFPFASLAWIALMFAFQAAVNEGILHRDPGLGDTWHCPLPNGYQILMIDTTDQGFVYNPKTQIGDGVSERDDSIGGISLLQVAGRYVLGGYDTRPLEESHQGDPKVDSYFLLDTQLGKHNRFSSYADLEGSALALGIKLNLEPIDAVYSKYRFSWFEVFAGVLTLLPIMVFTIVLIRMFIQVRRIRSVAA
jgi:hypothetical protein